MIKIVVIVGLVLGIVFGFSKFSAKSKTKFKAGAKNKSKVKSESKNKDQLKADKSDINVPNLPKTTHINQPIIGTKLTTENLAKKFGSISQTPKNLPTKNSKNCTDLDSPKPVLMADQSVKIKLQNLQKVVFSPNDQQIIEVIKSQIAQISADELGKFLTAKDIISPYEKKMYKRLKQTLYHSKIFIQIAFSALITTSKGLNRTQTFNLRNKFITKYVDFVIYNDSHHKIQAIIELDDSTHLTKEQIEQDNLRNQIFHQAGFGKVIRFTKIPSKKYIFQQDLTLKPHRISFKRDFYPKKLLNKSECKIYADLCTEFKDLVILPKVSCNALISNQKYAPSKLLIHQIIKDLAKFDANFGQKQIKVNVSFKQIIITIKHEVRSLFNTHDL